MKVCFKVEGAFVVDKMRGLMLDGEEDRAFKGLVLAFHGMTGELAERMLKGECTLSGYNNDITLDETPDPEYIKELAEIRECTAKLKETEFDINDWKNIALDLAEDFPNAAKAVARKRLPYKKQVKDGEKETAEQVKHRVVERLMRTDAGYKIAEHIGVLPEVELVYPFKSHTITVEDTSHSTWLISPKGELYKIPYQDHNNWITDNKENLKNAGTMIFDAECDYQGVPSYMRQGWVRVSGGGGLVIINAHIDAGIHKRSLFDFVMKFAANNFILDIGDSPIMEMDIDYKRVMRLLNENIKSWA